MVKGSSVSKPPSKPLTNYVILKGVIKYIN
jgi:hypothetical protein